MSSHLIWTTVNQMEAQFGTRCENALASGRWGTVHALEDTDYVIKSIQMEKSEAELLFEEVLTLIRLQGCRHVIELLAYEAMETHMNLLFFRYERTLHDALSQPSTDAQKLSWMKQLAMGLNECHARQVIHGDIKPVNILMNGDELVLADFGISRMNGEMICGTLASYGYRCPSMVQYSLGEDWYDRRVYTSVDMWSMGCVYAELILGRRLIGCMEWAFLREIQYLSESPPELELAERYCQVEQWFLDRSLVELNTLWKRTLLLKDDARPTAEELLKVFTK